MKRYLLIALMLGLIAGALAGDFDRTDVKFLAKTWPLSKLESVLIPREEWKPFPTVSNPGGLEAIPEEVRKAHIAWGEQALNETWDPLPATLFLEYVRIGNRSNFQRLQFGRREQLVKLVLAELFERQGRFMDQIVNGIWAVCEESFWGVPAHVRQSLGPGLPDVTEPYVDLFAAETGAMIAWIHYLLKPQLDEISPVITKRMVHEVQSRILTPYLEHDDWGYLGFEWRNRTGYYRPVNNWNPWINSNVLTCALLLETNPERRTRLVYKAMDSIDNFVAPYPADGGCDEGPSYWNRAGASLYDCLELLYSASDGKIDIFDQPLIRNMGQYIYKTFISEPYYINFADASAKMHPEPPLVFRYGKAIGDETMMRFASFVAKASDFGKGAISGSFGGLNRQLPALFTLNELLATPAEAPYIRDVWFKDLQVMAARSVANSSRGLYLAAKGGHNDESHNHNDVGHFILYYDGRPVIVDAGAQTYTRQTFSSRRYELWNNQSAFHSLPTINGEQQMPGREYAASEVRYRANETMAELSLDIAGAFPENAAVEKWVRHLRLNRGRNVELVEEFQLKEWKRPFTLHFMTPIPHSTETAGIIKLGDVVMKYDDSRFSAASEAIELNDDRMSSNWGNVLYRINLTAKSQDRSGSHRIVFEKAE